MSREPGEVPDLSSPELGAVTEALSTQPLLIERFRLRVLSGPDAGAEHVSGGDSVTVGTHPSCDLRLSDTSMSRFHFQIRIDAGGAELRDLESKNGTRIGDVGILHARLERPTTIVAGRTEIGFERIAEHVEVPVSPRTSFGDLVGTSLRMRSLFAKLEKVAPSDSTILLQGETGTGKELVAEAIHAASARCEGPFHIVDCAALPRHLMEEELFGHVKGAYTGASSSRPGAMEAAHGGTVFLDEIGELDTELQPKLLRVLEQRTIQRVGETDRRPIDVRVIAATSRNLSVEVNNKRFRPDLYYRLGVVRLDIPPLRERLDDLPVLIRALLEQMGRLRDPVAQMLLAPDYVRSLAAHAWPGNVRELRNTLERCVVLGEPTLAVQGEVEAPLVDPHLPLRAARERWSSYYERRYLEALLALHEDNVSAAARAAGVDRGHFYRLLRRASLR